MLQVQTVKPQCLALLNELMTLEELNSFRLAGGTALSLLLGHRVSIDLDFFTNQLFDVNEFIIFLKTYFKDRVQIAGTNRYGVFTNIDHIKVDFLYRYEKFIDKENSFEALRLSSLKDIGAMKVQAAASRTSKKDYYDLFELLNVFTFAELIGFFSIMHPNYDVAGTLKSLSNFSEADLEEGPVSLKSINWQTVKDRISLEIRNYIQFLQQKKLDAEKTRQNSINDIFSKKKNKN